HKLLFDTRDDGDLTDPDGQHEMHAALHGLLVVHQAIEYIFGRDARHRRYWTVSFDQVQDVDRVLGGYVTSQLPHIHDPAHSTLPHTHRRSHTPGIGLAVQDTGITGLRFQLVTERLAEVQDTPHIRFPLVTRYDFCFHPHSFGNYAIHGFRLSGQHFAAVFRQV